MKKLLLAFLLTSIFAAAQGGGQFSGGGTSGASTNPTSGTIPVKCGLIFCDSHIVDSVNFTVDGSGNVSIHSLSVGVGNTGQIDLGISVYHGSVSGSSTITVTPTGALLLSRLVDVQAALGNVTPAVGSDSTLFTTTIPAAAMSANSCLDVDAQYKHTGAVSQSYKFKYGTGVFTVTAGSTSTNAQHLIVSICNIGSTGTQNVSVKYWFAGGTDQDLDGFVTANPTTFTVDSTASQTLVLTAQAASGTDTVTPRFWEVNLRVK